MSYSSQQETFKQVEASIEGQMTGVKVEMPHCKFSGVPDGLLGESNETEVLLNGEPIGLCLILAQRFRPRARRAFHRWVV